MPFVAASAAPCGASAAFRHPTIDRAIKCPIAVFCAPPGYLSTLSLAAALEEGHQPVLWLRLELEDRDPATFLHTLIAGAQRLCPGVGRSTLEQMRQRPGPLHGWPPLFAQFGQEFAEALPAIATLVLERCHYLSGLHPTLRLFSTHLVPAISASISCVLIAHQPLPHADLPEHTVHYGVADLRFNERATCDLAEHLGARLATGALQRAVDLTEGRAVVLEDLFVTSAIYGAASIGQIVAHVSNLEELLTQVARYWLATAAPVDLQALALAVQIEYSHPDLIRIALERGALPAGPWLQPLAHSWQRVRLVWHAPLQKALGSELPEHEALRRVAYFLADQGAIERAVALYLAIGDTTAAARTIAESLRTVMDLGQWEMLAAWLRQLPSYEFHAWPWLVYARGEIALVQSDLHAARDAFAVASSSFAIKHDTVGMCLSRLAESSLASKTGDSGYAQERAQSALDTAESAALPHYQSWAAWHLGRLSAEAGDIDAALTFYERAATAAAAAGDITTTALMRPTRQHALRQRDLRRQREFFRQSYFAAEQAEHQAGKVLRQDNAMSLNRVAALLGAHGWLHTPLALKLPIPSPTTTISALNEVSFDRQLPDPGGIEQGTRLSAAAQPAVSAWPSLEIPLPLTRASTGLLPARQLQLTSALDTTTVTLIESAHFNGWPLDQNVPGRDTADTSIPMMVGTPKEQHASVAELAPLPSLTVHLLGQFRVIVNDRLIEDWPSGRGQALLKYLLTHRDRPVPRDILMDVFWPDAGPKAARNNLNVTLHRLRQALRAVDDLPIVIFENGAYRLSPDLQIWIDIDEFECHVQAGRQLEATKQIPASADEYALAIGLYHGDFLENDLYDDWILMTREQLRMDYLDTLDRLSQIYFTQGQYAACNLVGRLLLERDNCREDAHCRLMRCYSRQGQRYLALRQYQVCVEALRAELDVEPEPTTTQIYECIRRRERV
jgi:DNA-binding SARP family transcriptional activator